MYNTEYFLLYNDTPLATCLRQVTADYSVDYSLDQMTCYCAAVLSYTSLQNTFHLDLGYIDNRSTSLKEYTWDKILVHPWIHLYVFGVLNYKWFIFGVRYSVLLAYFTSFRCHQFH